VVQHTYTYIYMSLEASKVKRGYRNGMTIHEFGFSFFKHV